MITPSSYTARGKEVVHFTSDTSVAWSTTSGALFTDALATVSYVGGSRTDIYFKAQNKTSNGNVVAGASTATVVIVGVFPAVPHFPHDFNVGKRGVVGIKSRSGKVSGRVIGDGRLMQDFDLRFNLRNRGEFIEVRQFVNDHFPGTQFYYVEPVVAVDALFTLDGDPPMKVTYDSGNRLSFSVPIFMV